ncbi:MAG: acetoin utilization protein AcuC [Actinomycetia bacterium]|nr:acetoin utilization protein AcuC [Actinomycetes bacterium]
MATTARVIWDDVLTEYDFGVGHPMAPLRLDLTARLCEAFGVFDLPGVDVRQVDIAPDELLATVHDPGYIAAVKAASADPGAADVRRGLGTEDDPAFPGMHDASARIASGTQIVCEGVWKGETLHGVNFCGGMHHAMADRAAGFCIYNDIAVGIQWLLDNGAERVAYVDVDVHHGDGVEAIFWDDPRVLTISLHENGRILFPGTGWPADIGGPDAEGSAANVALPPGVTDSAWLRAINSVVDPLVRAFRPDIMVTQHGCDTHIDDPLAHLAVTVDAQRMAIEAMHQLSHEICDGRWVALGGGGYSVVEVVPRTWTHMTAIAAHAPIEVRTETPQQWRDYVEGKTSRPAPRRMGDVPEASLPIWVQPWAMGYNPESPIDRAIMAAREATFSHHGLDHYYD